MKACLGWNASEKRCSYGGECRGCRGYREGLLAAARMASAKAGTFVNFCGHAWKGKQFRKLRCAKDGKCRRCLLLRFAADLRKKAGKK